MNLDYSDDWLVLDDTRTVSYLSKLTHSTFAPGVSVAGALRRAVTKTELALGPAPTLASKAFVVWHLPKANMGAIGPKIGDVIVDDQGKRWVVNADAEELDEGQRFRLTCVKGP